MVCFLKKGRMVKRFFLLLIASIPAVHAVEYPLIEKLEVTKDTITVVPNELFQKKYMHPGKHVVKYHDPLIDLRQFDQSVHVMPFVFDLLPMILLADETYYVDELDTEVCKSLERIKIVFQKMYPNTQWKGELICKKKVKHHFEFSSPKIMTLFSGGVDSTYSLLSNLDKNPILFSLKGQFDSNNSNQWNELMAIAKRITNLLQCQTTTASSMGIYLVNRKEGLRRSTPSDIAHWPVHTDNDLRWVGKAIPLMIFYQVPVLEIPSGISKDYPFKRIGNSVMDGTVRFGNCLHFHSSGFDRNRTKKTQFIVNFFKEYFPEEQLTLKVCFDKQGKNCSQCRKCTRTIVDLYLCGADPNQCGFHTSVKEAKANFLKFFNNVEHEDRAHREWDAFDVSEQLKFIEENHLYGSNDVASCVWEACIDHPLIVDVRERPTDYYEKLQKECEEAWSQIH